MSEVHTIINYNFLKIKIKNNIKKLTTKVLSKRENKNKKITNKRQK